MPVGSFPSIFLFISFKISLSSSSEIRNLLFNDFNPLSTSFFSSECFMNITLLFQFLFQSCYPSMQINLHFTFRPSKNMSCFFYRELLYFSQYNDIPVWTFQFIKCNV